MGIGASVFLLAVGGILAFAMRDTTLGGVLDLHVVGWILILVGLVGLITTLVIFGRRRRTIVERPATRTYERRVIDDDVV